MNHRILLYVTNRVTKTHSPQVRPKSPRESSPQEFGHWSSDVKIELRTDHCLGGGTSESNNRLKLKNDNILTPGVEHRLITDFRRVWNLRRTSSSGEDQKGRAAD